MKKENTVIEVGHGLGPLEFGMSRDEVIEVLGKPDEVDAYTYSEEDGGGKAESWHYDEMALSLEFDEVDDWVLLTIAVSSEEYSINDINLIGLSMDKVEDHLFDLGVLDLEREDHSTPESPNHILLSSDSTGINFWFDENILSEIQWGPVFEDEETILWS